jgi:pimeloyl-ACP methyl ester carboxylesterase
VPYQRLKQREHGLGRSFTDEAFKEFVLSDDLAGHVEQLRHTLDEWRSRDLQGSARRVLELLDMRNINSFVLVAVVGLLSSMNTRAADTAEKYTYVIVHGATAGGWEWKRTGNFLSDDGHTVYRVTLTGLGERMHLNSPEIDLETHVNDVVNVILFEDLSDVVLTGHSYGGMVITGVMDRVPERIRHVIFLDAAVPDDGMSLWDLFGGNGPRDPSRFADGFMQVPWVKPDTPPPHNVKQSIKCFNQPVSYKNPAALALPVTYVAFVPRDKSAEERAQTDQSWQRAVARGWTIRTFPGGHVAQEEDPRGVATLMVEAVGDVNQPVNAAGK